MPKSKIPVIKHLNFALPNETIERKKKLKSFSWEEILYRGIEAVEMELKNKQKNK